jgi:DNA topoisomerase-1
MDTKFTSQMESSLDKIEEGTANSQSVLKEFYDLFSVDMARAKEEMTREKGMAEPSGRTCEKCGKPMVIRWSKSGRFVACSGYPACRNTLPLDENGQAVEPVATDEKCEKCGSPMVMKSGRRGRFLACSKYPECRSTVSVDETGKPIRMQTTDENCEKCGKPMVVKPSRRGPFMACSGYPKCRNAKPLPTGIPCPTEGCKGQIVRRYARGRGAFFGCSNYPTCKYTTRELPGTPAQSTPTPQPPPAESEPKPEP